MMYKIKKLKVESDESVDIPEGCIPMKYQTCVVTKSSGGKYGPVRELLVLEPIKEEKSGDEKKDREEICFFCEREKTRDIIGIRPICVKCLTIIYMKAKEAHRTEC